MNRAEELKYAAAVIAGLMAIGHGLTDHDRATYMAEVIAIARDEGRAAERSRCLQVVANMFADCWEAGSAVEMLKAIHVDEERIRNERDR